MKKKILSNSDIMEIEDDVTQRLRGICAVLVYISRSKITEERQPRPPLQLLVHVTVVQGDPSTSCRGDGGDCRPYQ